MQLHKASELRRLRRGAPGFASANFGLLLVLGQAKSGRHGLSVCLPTNVFSLPTGGISLPTNSALLESGGEHGGELSHLGAVLVADQIDLCPMLGSLLFTLLMP